jgi:hypothetical protein
LLIKGVVSKPIEGAKKGGLSGFLKGTGKGLIGAVVRPVSGVVDMATSVADSVKTFVTLLTLHYCDLFHLLYECIFSHRIPQIRDFKFTGL